MTVVLRIIVVIIAAFPLIAQTGATPEPRPTPEPAPAADPRRTAEPQPIRSAVELQLYNFGNFFQARQGLPERNVNAVGAAYRATWTLRPNGPDVYGRASLLRYSGGASETSYTGQAGVSKYGSVHWYDVYVERTKNGYAFEIDETRASANITALSGHYSYAITPAWRVGTDAYLDWTRFDVDTGGLETDYASIGFDVRYRGFGDIIQPRIGYVAGQRESGNGQDDASDRYWFAELRTKPHPSFDFRLRYRDRTRDYENVARVDERAQWTLRAAIKQTARVSWSASYSTEQVDSSVPGRDFDRSTAYVALIYGF